MSVLGIKISALEALNPLKTRSFSKSRLTVSTWEHSMSPSCNFLQMKAENQNFPQMTIIQLENWYLRSRINLWCKHKFTNMVLSLCWQMSKLIVWHFWSAYFNQHLPLQPPIEKRRKQSCTPNNIALSPLYYSFINKIEKGKSYKKLYLWIPIPYSNYFREKVVLDWHHFLSESHLKRCLRLQIGELNAFPGLEKTGILTCEAQRFPWRWIDPIPCFLL